MEILTFCVETTNLEMGSDIVTRSKKESNRERERLCESVCERQRKGEKRRIQIKRETYVQKEKARVREREREKGRGETK